MLRGLRLGSFAMAVAAQPNAVVLDGDPVTVTGLRVWGIGDPRYTPDRQQGLDREAQAERAAAFAPSVATQLHDDAPLGTVDVALVHDERIAADLGFQVPLVLAGHRHEHRQDTIGEALLHVEASTGGAGLRALDAEEPEPLSCSILYFDATSDRLRPRGRRRARWYGRPDRVARLAEAIG
ncbi:MAG: hypothetical protein ACRD0G_01960, partial [Acidimicrobiales bacterium]